MGVDIKRKLNLEETRDLFTKDKYAALNGFTIDEVGPGSAKCSVKLAECHENIRGGVHGGVIFSLADFCYGVANEGVAVSLTSEINYLAASKGSVLTAEARCRKDGRSTVFYDISVTDDLGKDISFITMTGFRITPKE